MPRLSKRAPEAILFRQKYRIASAMLPCPEKLNTKKMIIQKLIPSKLKKNIHKLLQLINIKLKRKKKSVMI